MSRFELPANSTDNPKALFRRSVRRRVTISQVCLSTIELDIPVSSSFELIDEKILREYSAPSAANIPTRPEVNIGDGNFELKSGIITMAQAQPFCGKDNEDASAYLQ